MDRHESGDMVAAKPRRADRTLFIWLGAGTAMMAAVSCESLRHQAPDFGGAPHVVTDALPLTAMTAMPAP